MIIKTKYRNKRQKISILWYKIDIMLDKLHFHPAKPPPYTIEVFSATDLMQRSSKRVFSASYQYRCYMLVWVTAGKTQQWLDFEPIILTAGTLAIVKPEQIHSYGTDRDWQGWIMLFQPETLSQTALAELDTSQLPNISHYSSDTAKVLTQSLFQLYQDNTHSVPSLLLRYQLYALLIRILTLQEEKNAVPSSKSTARLSKFDELINRYFKQQHDVAFYAKSLHCSEKSLNRASLQADSRSAKQRIDDRIILEAKRLLLHSSESAVSISEELGFQEATHFNKFFKRKTGQTPIGFRKVSTTFT